MKDLLRDCVSMYILEDLCCELRARGSESVEEFQVAQYRKIHSFQSFEQRSSRSLAQRGTANGAQRVIEHQIDVSWCVPRPSAEGLEARLLGTGM
jgi:hypothetical protein